MTFPIWQHKQFTWLLSGSTQAQLKFKSPHYISEKTERVKWLNQAILFNNLQSSTDCLDLRIRHFCYLYSTGIIWSQRSPSSEMHKWVFKNKNADFSLMSYSLGAARVETFVHSRCFTIAGVSNCDTTLTASWIIFFSTTEQAVSTNSSWLK